MPNHLLIVESPAKAKTIEKFLGKDFKVKSSYGHVRDLDKGNKAVDVSNGFSPKYVVSPDKTSVVEDLKNWVKKSDEVWLATDEDREGEAISWHLCEVLGLEIDQTKRIVFREITKPAIQKAIKNPRKVDINLVNAQQARRILDRLVGFELSEILWKKIRGRLSAGRVQSVAVKLVVERERSITSFEITSFYKLMGYFGVKNEHGKTVELKAESPSRFQDAAGARSFLEKCKDAVYTIQQIDVKPLKRKPAPPFTTSTLQQEASRKLGYGVKRTMMIAQRLYEAGHITYMRTDSTSLSEIAMSNISDEIEKQYGKKYVQPRRFKSKSANAQEAHEAIRPTYIDRHTVTANNDEQRLYELIWKRTIASQMAEALLEKTTVKIGVSTIPNAVLQAIGEVLKFDGFLKVYLESKDDDEEEEAKGMLPPLKVGQNLNLIELKAMERFTRPPARFTEAALVKKLEELGIGRPSTYAPIISKIMETGRGYVVKESREGDPRHYQVLTLKNTQITAKQLTEITGAVKNRLFPTDMGMIVSDFLEKYFDSIMDYGFTAGMEKEFDVIAAGQIDWRKILEDFYGPFHKTVEDTIEHAERPAHERILGKDPDSGRTVLCRMSRKGPVVQIGSQDELDEEEKPKYASLLKGQSLESITFEEAMKLFQLPREVGSYEGTEVVIGRGPYGPYVKHNGKFISIPRGEDPLAISFDRAVEVILEKRKADAPVATYKGLPITKGVGRFGPFLKWNNLFVNVPKKYNFDNLSTDEMFELIEKKVEKEKNRYIHQWPDEQISVENGRWGPLIKFKKKTIKIPKVDGKRVTPEEAKEYTLDDVKRIIELEIPDAFKKKAPKKKTTKKTTSKTTKSKKK